ncbi:hypothetical protein Tco_1033538, partial [Tanacetum coccineum]
MGTIDSMKSVLTQSALDALCEKFHILDVVHSELPGRNDRIRNSPTSNIGFFVIAASKVSHFKILCRVHGSVLTVEMDLFAFIHHADPIKVQIGEREIREGEVQLLELTRGCVVPLAGVNDQGDANIQGVGGDAMNEGNGDAAVADYVIQDEGANIERRRADGASGSNHPSKKLKEDHGTSGDVGASTEVGVTAVATMPFVTSSVTPTPERGDGRPTDSVSTSDLRAQRPSKKFVISSDTPYDSSANATDDEFSSVFTCYTDH